MVKTKQIKDDLINSINSDKNRKVDDIVVGANLTAVESRNLGLASTIRDNHHPHKIIQGAGKLEILPINQLLNFLYSDILLKASVGMATLNSLIEPPEKYLKGNAFEIIQSQSLGKNLGIIGHFYFVDRFKTMVKNLWVFEKEPQGEDLPEEKIYEYLPDCDVLVITAQTIINGSIAEILNLSPQAYKILLGPSVPLSPVLFDYGIAVLAGVRINDKQIVKKYIQQGANFRQLAGIELIMIQK